MVLSVSSDVTLLEEKLPISERPLLSRSNIDQQDYELEKKRYLKPAPSIDTGNRYALGDGPFEVKDHLEKIECTGFSFNNPWLPANALKLLDKVKEAH